MTKHKKKIQLFLIILQIQTIWGGILHGQSQRFIPAVISILDRYLACKPKTSLVSVICCESWELWRKHLKRSACTGFLHLLLKSISRLTPPYLPPCSDGCSASVSEEHKYTQADGTPAQIPKTLNHPCRASTYHAASGRGPAGCQEAGLFEGGGWGGWFALADKDPPSLSNCLLFTGLYRL